MWPFLALARSRWTLSGVARRFVGSWNKLWFGAQVGVIGQLFKRREVGGEYWGRRYGSSGQDGLIDIPERFIAGNSSMGNLV